MSEPKTWDISRSDMQSFTANERGEMEHVVYVYPPDPAPRIPVFAGPNNDARERAQMIVAVINKAIEGVWQAMGGDHEKETNK